MSGALKVVQERLTKQHSFSSLRSTCSWTADPARRNFDQSVKLVDEFRNVEPCVNWNFAPNSLTLPHLALDIAAKRDLIAIVSLCLLDRKPSKMNIVDSLKAFIYCAGEFDGTNAVCPRIGGDWHTRWLTLQNLLKVSETPAYLVVADSFHVEAAVNDAKFDFAKVAHSKEQLSSLMSEPSLNNPTSIIIAGCYAETLITEVSLLSLRQGYETFVIWDRVWAISEAGLEAAKARLLQAGTVPTSVDQVSYRWDR